MKDNEFAREIEDIMKRNKKEPHRLNARLDIELVECSRDERFAEFKFEVKEWSLNPYGEVHGGVICAVFDTSLGLGAAALSQQMICTTDLSVSYLCPFDEEQYIFRSIAVG